MSGTQSIAVIEDSDEDFTSLTRAMQGIVPPVELIRYRTAEEFIAYLGADGRDGRPGWLITLLDLNLPGRSGWSVLKFIREKDRLASLPVVVLSGSADHAGIEDAYRLGARGYVVKPFEGKLLAQVMAAVVEYWRTVTLPHLTTGRDHDEWLTG